MIDHKRRTRSQRVVPTGKRRLALNREIEMAALLAVLISLLVVLGGLGLD